MRSGRWIMAAPMLCSLAMTMLTTPTTNAEAPDPNNVDVQCATDLDLMALAGQVTLTLVSDPAVLTDPTRPVGLSGIAPVGNFVELIIRQRGSAPWFDLNPDLDDGLPPPLFASDEEGGSVQRFGAFLGSIPSARRQVDEFTPEQVKQLFVEYGHLLSELGVTMAFAPVVDVGGAPAIGSRSYGDDPDVVTEYAGAVIDGYLEAGVIPVLKHFPGHGRASADSHDGPAVTPPLDELRQLDLLPFAALLSADVAVMVGHLDVPGLTDGMPASLSPAAIDGLLRREMGFDGLVVSDALGMGAIRQVATPEQAIVMFLQAGGDLALVDWADAEEARTAVVAAVSDGELDTLRLHQAVNRVLRVKGGLTQNCSVPLRLVGDAAMRGAIVCVTTDAVARRCS